MVDAIERALGGEAKCSDLLQMITAARGAINGLMAEVLDEHVVGVSIAARQRSRLARVGCRQGANRDQPLLSHVGCVRDRVRSVCKMPYSNKDGMLNRSTLKLAFALLLDSKRRRCRSHDRRELFQSRIAGPAHVFSLMAGVGVPERSPPSKPREAFGRCLPIFRFWHQA